jgi:hypothetical protein
MPSLSKATKERYRIRPNRDGNWMGQCPTCNLVIEANDPAVSQTGVVAGIQRHEESDHGRVGTGD